MLWNYITIALRNMRKHLGFSAINILGLAVGVACCLLLLSYVRYEWSFDQFHEKADRLYRAWVLEDLGVDKQFFNTVTPIPLGPALVNTFPEVERAIRISTFNARVQKGTVAFDESIHIVDAGFFEVFDFPLRRGGAEPLAETNAVVLTPETATRYFGTEDPVGQTLTIRIGAEDQEFRVTALTDVLPRTSSISFTMVVPWAKSFDLFDARQRRSWGNVIPETYVLLQEQADVAALEAKFPQLVQQRVGNRDGGSYTIGLQPMTDIHLNPAFPRGLAPVSDPAYAYILTVLALLVLGIACINVVTLSVARSTSRSMEVGVRKVMGADRTQLMQQFWGESGVLAVLAVLSGVVLAWVSLPFFNTLAGTELGLGFDGWTLLLLAGLAVLLGWVAGSYPALVLSRFSPVAVLKGTAQVGKGKGWLRQGLMVAQFAFAVFLITSALIMNHQLQYMQNKDLGFDQAQVVVIPLQGVVTAGMRGGMSGMRTMIDGGMNVAERFKQALAQHPEVERTAAASFMPGTTNWLDLGYTADDGRFLKFQMNAVDPDFIETLGMELVAGRNFGGYGTADANRGLIVNQALVAAYGWENPIGQRLPGPFGDHEVIGVVRDFHFKSLHTPIEPVALVMNVEPILAGISDINVSSSPIPKLFVRLAPGSVATALGTLETVWDRLADGQTFSFSFLDARIESQYRAEQQLRRLVIAATLLSIFIACFGLLGLVALTVAHRTKEIGMRKVLGASVPGIVLLLCKDFARLILIAFLVATPVVYLVMSRWLQAFAYRVGLGPGLFVLAGVLAVAVVLLTVSYQSIKAALANPVESLRYE